MVNKKNGVVFGVGINDAEYVLRRWGSVDGKNKVIWTCPFYVKWKNMLLRCYSQEFKKDKPTYNGCTVCDDWLLFSNFKAWMEQQDWEGKELDKDILFKGNKLYSPDTCVFVTKDVNSFFNDKINLDSECLTGVSSRPKANRFRARCWDVNLRKRVHLGDFDSEYLAHQAWLQFKIEQANILAARQTDIRISESLLRMFNGQDIL